MSIHFTTVSCPDELQKILDLQAENLPTVLTADAVATQGFVTVRHDPAVLRRMNNAHPSVIAKVGHELAGYCLMMPRDFAPAVPVLAPMFAVLAALRWRDQPLSDNPRWFVMGQVCVAAPHRGKGVFDGMYRKLCEVYRGDFDFVITEISERNARSLRAHERIGFRRLHRYTDGQTGEVWWVVVWDFADAALARSTRSKDGQGLMVND